jgi:hypothetical protein
MPAACLRGGVGWLGSGDLKVAATVGRRDRPNAVLAHRGSFVGNLRARFVCRVTTVLAERPSAESFDESLPRHPSVLRKDLALTWLQPWKPPCFLCFVDYNTAREGPLQPFRTIACTYLTASSYDLRT